MQLWILRPIDVEEKDSLWYTPYDKMFGFVVRAKTEKIARRIAHRNGGDENRSGKSPWLHGNLTTCERLTDNGHERLVMADFNAG